MISVTRKMKRAVERSARAKNINRQASKLLRSMVADSNRMLASIGGEKIEMCYGKSRFDE